MFIAFTVYNKNHPAYAIREIVHSPSVTHPFHTEAAKAT